MWWTRARPEHYTISKEEPDAQHLQQEIRPEAIQANKEPLDKEPPLGASEAILEKMANTLGKTIENPPCLEASYTTVSP